LTTVFFLCYIAIAPAFPEIRTGAIVSRHRSDTAAIYTGSNGWAASAPARSA
jgi:hypothetical protein